jgi:hypothetical protein
MALTLDDTQSAALLTALGLPPDTADVDLVVAAVADLASQAAGINAEAPATIAAAARKAGLEVVDGDTLAALRTDAASGRQMAAAAKAQKIEAAVDDAITKGKVTPGRKAHWVSLCSHDEQMLATLAAFPNELAAPMSEVGHSIDAVDADAGGGWFY